MYNFEANYTYIALNGFFLFIVLRSGFILRIKVEWIFRNIHSGDGGTMGHLVITQNLMVETKKY